MSEDNMTMDGQAAGTAAEKKAAAGNGNKAGEKDRQMPRGFLSLIFRLLHTDGEDDNALKQLKSVRKQLTIDGQWFKKQIGVLVLAVLGTICYITCRFQAQQELILIEQLKKDRTDWTYRSLTRNSELTFKTRQSLIEKSLKNFGDSTLKAGTQSPVITTITNE